MKEGGEHLVQESPFVWGTEAGRARTADAEKTIPLLTPHPSSQKTNKPQKLQREEGGGREAEQLLANLVA